MAPFFYQINQIERRTLNKKRTIFILCLIFAFLFSVVGGAYAAETLRLITWSGYTPKVLLDKFEKETGIKVMPTNSSNEEMIAKLRATRGAGFDLAHPLDADTELSIALPQTRQFDHIQKADKIEIGWDQQSGICFPRKEKQD